MTRDDPRLGCIALMCLSAAIIYSGILRDVFSSPSELSRTLLGTFPVGILGDVFSSLLRLAGVETIEHSARTQHHRTSPTEHSTIEHSTIAHSTIEQECSVLE